ncbi:MAG: cytochrome c family protein [Epsilonproteobacteria bacterium]|nr:cytochrome c family protein [Campylobacterota bacterium]
MAKPALENQTCKACHPKIYKEYQNSMHRKSSIYNNEVHRAIWEKHPASKKGNYKCATCHTPSDHDLISGKSNLHKNAIQTSEPISCQHCHQIQSIEKHQKANKNILTTKTKTKTFFATDHVKKGTKLEYKDKKMFFGLLSKKVGSPYHDIDYSNENYYTGELCMGCHSHKQNSHDFAICDLEVKEGDSKETCISCHMPQVKGSMANQKQTPTHSFHGATALTLKPNLLSKYIGLTLTQKAEGFTITLENHANHTLVPHPLRVAKLKVEILRHGKTITLKSKTFKKVIGTAGKATMPWLADSVISDNSIKAFEKRALSFTQKLQIGDQVTATFGYHIVNEKSAKLLNIQEQKNLDFIVLTKKQFTL